MFNTGKDKNLPGDWNIVIALLGKTPSLIIKIILNRINVAGYKHSSLLRSTVINEEIFFLTLTPFNNIFASWVTKLVQGSLTVEDGSVQLISLF
jgi:hypothetical protein